MPRRFENRAEVETERLAKSDFRFSRAALLCMRAALPAALALGVSWSSEAVAQTTTSNTTITIGPNVGRRLPGADVGSEYHYRDARRWWINYDECLADEYFDFPIAVSNPKNRFEVWAGNGEDCGQKRSLQDMGQCWIVYSNDRPTDNFTASIPVRNIVAHIEDTVDVPMGVGQDVCEQSTDSDGLSVKLYFFISDGGTIVGTEKIWDPTNLGGLGFDLVGPEPPGNITLGMGENQLSVNLDNVQDEPDRERFAAFCAPGVFDDAFVPAPGLQPGCSAIDMALTPGARPAASLKCGEASETSDTITTDRGLPAGDVKNDVLYAIGVSGEDAVGNSGPLSSIECGSPQELYDFFELYGGAGGPGGGGFCSVSPGVPRSAPGALAMLGIAFATLAIRRRRSRA